MQASEQPKRFLKHFADCRRWTAVCRLRTTVCRLAANPQRQSTDHGDKESVISVTSFNQISSRVLPNRRPYNGLFGAKVLTTTNVRNSVVWEFQTNWSFRMVIRNGWFEIQRLPDPLTDSSVGIKLHKIAMCCRHIPVKWRCRTIVVANSAMASQNFLKFGNYINN